MMEDCLVIARFWYWLKHTDAKNVSHYALVGLVCICIMWIWQELVPDSGVDVIKYPGAVSRAPADISASRFLATQLAIGGNVMGDPFTTTGAWRPVRAPNRNWREAFVKPRPPTALTPSSPVPPGNPTGVPDPGRPATTARTVGLVYHGMMVRTDRERIALIENRTTRTVSFYKAGQKVEWLTVGRIESNCVELVSSDGAIADLGNGMAIVFEENGP